MSRRYSGSGTYHGYHVEVRIKESMIEDAYKCGDDLIVTKNWKRVPVMSVPCWGVTNELWDDRWASPHARELGLLTWEAANAIAAHIAAHHHMYSWLFEFRFVEVEVKHSYSHREVKSSSAFTFKTKHEVHKWEVLSEEPNAD